MKADAAAGAAEKEQEQQEVQRLICEEVRGIIGHGDWDGNGSADRNGWDSESQPDGEGQVKRDDEYEIDWITIGNSGPLGGDTWNRKASHRPGYPPLRSARGEGVASRTTFIGTNL